MKFKIYYLILFFFLIASCTSDDESGNQDTNAPRIEVQGELSYTFGNWVLNSDVSKTFIIKNTSTSNLSVSSLEVADGFSIVSEFSINPIPPNGLSEFIIGLDTDLVGTKSGNIIFITNDPNQQEVTISLTGNVVESISLTQFSPILSDWSTFQSKAIIDNPNVTSHDPDGILWIDASKWEEAKWDGTIYNPSIMSKDEFHKAICANGSGDRIRGIRKVYYQTMPFTDEENPTKAEVDEWHRIAINHLRALVGYTSEERQVKKDVCMFARALWGQQRRFTNMWDSKYPGTFNSAYGPCVGGSNSHCGATFVPDYEDQKPYLPEGHPECTTTQGSEGVSPAPKSNIPWSIKWSRAFCSYLGNEGFWGGHVGPFFHREKFGFSFWDLDKNNLNSNAMLRAKWTGNLMPNLYINPN